MKYSSREIGQDIFYNSDVWSGLITGASFEYMRNHPEEAYLEALDQIQHLPPDKAAHAWASYSIARGTIKGVETARPETSFWKKAGAATATANAVMLTWEYNQARNGGKFDLADIAANNTGIKVAVTHEAIAEYLDGEKADSQRLKTTLKDD